MTILSFFNLRPSDIRANPALGDDLRKYGVTHLEICPVYHLHELPWCKAEGFRVVCFGDNFMRTPADRLVNCSEANVTNSAFHLRESGICDGIEMVDETYPDPKAYYPSAENFVRWWRDAGGPPIAWPGWAPQEFEVPELSDYCSRQWPWTHYTNYKARLKAVKERLANLPNDNRRVCVMIPVVAEWYSEYDAVPGLSPGDVVWNRGMTSKGIENLMKAARRIVAPREIQYRLYGFDYPDWAKQRAEAKVGHRGRLQTGVGPHVDKRRWREILGVCKEITGGVKV